MVDVTVPCPPGPLPGITMAGFRQRVPAAVDIAMVAHPSVTLLFNLGEGEWAVYQAHGRPVRGNVVIGLLPGDLRVAGAGPGECLQIRLGPVAAAAMFGAPAELSGTALPLKEVWGTDAGRAQDRLRSAPSWDERFAIAAEILGRQLAARPPVDPEVAYTWQRTLTSRGRARIDGMADELGWSRKRLWSRFRSQLGITPKRAARLVRFDHAAHLLAAGQPAASVAAVSGYADQSHLHREVKTFTGLTPTAVACAPWLAIDDVAWPSASPARNSGKGGARWLSRPGRENLAQAGALLTGSGAVELRGPARRGS
jgi:AraC-like DNA-binding protein